MTSDTHARLKAYAVSGSEDAFRELVTCYVGLVYSTALRLVGGDTHRAEDVTQTVFADLARHAGEISPKVLLGGWLHQRAFNLATTVMRGERRRRAREQEAMQMKALEDDSTASLARIAPILDHAITQLKPDDRIAILLRFFERRNLRSIGQALGTNEDAAQKRVSRALDKLRALLARQGVALSATALGAALAADTLTAAPAALAGSVVGVALASTAAGTGTTTTLLKALIMSKFNSTVIGVIVVVAMSGIIIQQHAANAKLRAEMERLQGQLEPIGQPPQPATNVPAAPTFAGETKVSQDERSELLRLRGQIGVMTQDLLSLRSNRTALLKLSNMLRHPLDLEQFPDSYTPIKASTATNAGTATPAALLQTWLWALHTGDPDGLARAMDWPEGTSDAAKQEVVNSQAKWVQERGEDFSNSPEDYRLIALWPIGDEFYLATFRESNFPSFPTSVGRQFFRKTEEGWKVTNYAPQQGTFLKEGGRILEYK